MSLDLKSARSLSTSVEIALVHRADGSVAERLTLLRYAGHYRADSVDAFAVRDAFGKFSVRSARQLGLTDDSPFEAHIDLADDNEVNRRAS